MPEQLCTNHWMQTISCPGGNVLIITSTRYCYHYYFQKWHCIKNLCSHKTYTLALALFPDIFCAQLPIVCQYGRLPFRATKEPLKTLHFYRLNAWTAVSKSLDANNTLSWWKSSRCFRFSSSVNSRHIRPMVAPSWQTDRCGFLAFTWNHTYIRQRTSPSPYKW